MPVTARKFAVPAILMLLGRTAAPQPETSTRRGGITAIRSACPSVAVPTYTGDITLFDPPASTASPAIDVVATLTQRPFRLRGCDRRYRQHRQLPHRGAPGAAPTAARDVNLPYFTTVLRGGATIISKQRGPGHASLQCRGQHRASASAPRARATISARGGDACRRRCATR